MSTSALRPPVLYLSYNGLLEPLGRSQVLAYLSRLGCDYDITLVTFEKAFDLKDQVSVDSLKAECEQYGIEWHPRKYHHRPRLLATAWDLLQLLVDTWRYSSRENAGIVHCRSYVPAIAAWIMGKVTQVPFIFDMRALWPEEMITAGTLRQDSFTYKTLKWIEQRLLREAATVISLTTAAVVHIKTVYPELNKQNFEVIPTCVDLSKFDRKIIRPNRNFVLGSMGTVLSGWYHLDWLFLLFKTAAEKFDLVHLKIVTRDTHDVVLAKGRLAGLHNNIHISSSSPADIAKNIVDMSVGVLFFTSGISKLGSAPTRMGEFLASGIPVIGNRGVGDMADLIEHYKVGVVVEDGSEAEMRKGLDSLMLLLKDPELAARCRYSAADYFSVEKGVEKYRCIYECKVNDHISPRIAEHHGGTK